MAGPAGKIKLFADLEQQVEDINAAVKDAARNLRDLEKQANTVAKAGGTLNQAQVGQLQSSQQNLMALQNQQMALKKALESQQGQEALIRAVDGVFHKSLHKLESIQNNPLLAKVFSGGVIRPGDIGTGLQQIAGLVPGAAGVVAKFGTEILSGALKDLQTEQDVHRAYGRGAISREELGVYEQAMDQGGHIGESKEENVNKAASAIQALVDMAEEGRGEFIRKVKAGQHLVDKGQDAGAAYDEYLKAQNEKINLKARQLGRGLTPEERAQASRQAAAETLQKSENISDQVLQDAQEIEADRKTKLGPPIILQESERMAGEQSSLRREARRLPVKVKD